MSVSTPAPVRPCGPAALGDLVWNLSLLAADLEEVEGALMAPCDRAEVVCRLRRHREILSQAAELVNCWTGADSAAGLRSPPQ